jgi:arabinofuranosyltransferase
VDDAYISFRYGKNLMNGSGLVYNRGEYVEGYTNFLWAIITAPFTRIQSIDIATFTLTLGLLISIFNIYLLIRISKQFSNLFESKPPYFLLLPAIFFVLDDSVAFWAIGGMEFPMWTLFILSAIYFYFKINEKPRNYLLLAIFLMLCTLTRPEGNMIFVILMVHFFIFRKKIDFFKLKFLRILLLYALFVFLYYGFKFAYYGQVIPNTYYAKGVTDLSMNMLLGFKYIALCGGTRLYVLIFILFITFKGAVKDFKQSFLLLFSVVYILYIFIVGGDWMNANRFLVPVIPILYILSSIGLIRTIDKLGTINISFKKWANKLTGYALILLCTMLFIVTMSLLEYQELIIKDENYKYELQWARFGQWLKMNVSPNTIIAVGPAGKIPYYSELYTVDMWGLNNEHIARTESKRLQAGHKKFDFNYVLSFNPEFIIGHAGFTDDQVPSRYEKFNAPEEEYKSIDVVFRLKKEYRKVNR